MKNNISFLQLTLFLSLSFLSFQAIPKDTTNLNQQTLLLDSPKQNSLSSKSFAYYKLTLPQKNETKNETYLLFTLKTNTKQDLLDNIVSDPNLFISVSTEFPNQIENDWSSEKYGNELISITQKYLKIYKEYYISVYCEFKCNYILKAKLNDEYIIPDRAIFDLPLSPYDAIKISYKSRKNFNKLTFNAISLDMKNFNIFFAKESPSSSNTLIANPIFVNGYYFTIEKGDKNYETDYNYQILIENSEYDQNILIWAEYNDDEEVEIKELQMLFNNVNKDSPNCYFFNINEKNLYKNLIISTRIFNGNGILKIGGWEKLNNTKYEDNKDGNSIINDKSFILTKKDFEKYNKTDNKTNSLHFCFLSNEETAYSIRVYFQENSEIAQKFNFLYPGLKSETFLPANNVTRYELVYFDTNRDIFIDIIEIRGDPKLYVYYPNLKTYYINNELLSELKKNNSLLLPTKLNYNTKRVLINRNNNKATDSKYQSIFAIVECEGKIDCSFELLYDHVGSEISMKPKITYSNVIIKYEVDKYKIPILEDDVENIAIVLNQVTGKTKLEILSFISSTNQQYNLNEISQKINKITNHVEISAKDLKRNDLKGYFQIEVIGLSSASYNLYYYPFHKNNLDSLDHKTISMTLTKGQIYKDYILDGNHFKVYSYENIIGNEEKKDLFIYISSKYDSYLYLYIFKDLNDYYLENDKIRGYIWSSRYSNYVYISKNDTKYISEGNLYIMVYLKSYDEKDKDTPMYKKKTNITEYYIAVIDENTSLSLIEGIEFNNKITRHHKQQKYFYNHIKNQDFYLSISTPFSYAKVSLWIGGKQYISQKKIDDYLYLEIPHIETETFCPQSNNCGIDILVETYYVYDEYFDIIISCSSTEKIPITLKSGIPTKRKIMNMEKQYFIIDTIFDTNKNNIINVVFTYGKGKIYANKIKLNEEIDISKFPNEKKYDFIGTTSINGYTESLNIPYNITKEGIKLLVTVQGFSSFGFYRSRQFEYYITLSNVVDELIVNKNYKLYVDTGEIKYYHFKLTANSKKLYISMTNKDTDGHLYLSYGKNLDKNFYQWKNKGAYNEYIDINSDDPYFVERNKENLEGDYYLAIEVKNGCFFNLYITDNDIKIFPINLFDTAPCRCDNVGEFCYFRHEIVKSERITYPPSQEFIYYLEFTYGSAEIYAKLYPNGNNKFIIENLPNKEYYDYKSDNEYLEVKLSMGQTNYTKESILLLGVQCKQKSLFDINVRKLNEPDMFDDLSDFLLMNKDNVYYINSLNTKPTKYLFTSFRNQKIRYDAKAYFGSAKVKVYIDNDIFFATAKPPNETKYLADFSVDENDDDYFGILEVKDSFFQLVYFEITAIKNCLFFLHLNYDYKEILIPMNKEIVGQFIDNKIIAYIKLLPEYEQVILNIKNDNYNSDSTITVYAKTNMVVDSSLEQTTKYSYPSPGNYDTFAKTNSITKSLSMKINNIPYELQKNSLLKPITLLYITTDDPFQTSVNIIAYPNVGHIERIFSEQKTYSFSSLSHLNVDKTIFTLTKKNNDDDLLYVELSSCSGDFDFSLSENLDNNKQSFPENTIFGKKRGKSFILVPNIKDETYYLSVWGKKEDEIFSYEKEKQGVDFLLYYYTIKASDYEKLHIKNSMYLEYDDDVLIIYLPDIKYIDNYGKEKINNNIKYSVIISENYTDYKYMDSICFLTKKYDELKKEKQNYEIKTKNNKIQISGLTLNKYYYMNILATNTKTGEIFSLDPSELFLKKTGKTSKIIIWLLVILVIISCGVVFYFWRKIKLAKNAILFEDNKDNIKMSRLPKSINELQKIENKEIRVAKNKYNSLTEDSETTI